MQTIVPESQSHWLELRSKDVTSTEVAALFGCSPYATLFELWHRKRDKAVVEIEPSERMRWGNRLQDAIAFGIAEDEGWNIRRMVEYVRLEDQRMGSSFDFAIEGGGILEVKNVDALAYREGWLQDGEDIEAPPHIELQVQHQLAVSGRSQAFIGALIGGNTVKLIKRQPDEKIIGAIKDRVEQFWKSIDKGQEPSPDFAKDADFIAKLYGYAEAGKVIDLRKDQDVAKLAAQHKSLGEQIKALEAERDAIKSRLIIQIGDAERVLGDGFSISAGVVKATSVSYERPAYRNFRINWRKAKGESDV